MAAARSVLPVVWLLGELLVLPLVQAAALGWKEEGPKAAAKPRLVSPKLSFSTADPMEEQEA